MKDNNGVGYTSRFINNLNAYISAQKIKKKYIGIMAGIDSSKLSRLLNGLQPVTEQEMEKLSSAVGRDISFFLKEDSCISEGENLHGIPALLYAGNPSPEQKSFTLELISFLENVDEIMGAATRFQSVVEDGYAGSEV